MSFVDTWVPNIVCTISGIVLSGLIGFWQGKRAARMGELQVRLMRAQLRVEEERDPNLKFARDKDGNITGSRVIELRAEASGGASATANLAASPSTTLGEGKATHVNPK